MSILEDLKSSKNLIIGAGTTGKSLSRFLNSKNISYAIYDEKISSMDGIEVLSEIPKEVDIALVSPGWRLDNPGIVEMQNRGVRLISEIDLAWLLKTEINPEQKWVAVTGTNGKTTTVQMLESILNISDLSAIACGNVGLPAIEAVSSSENYQVLALELSSFQIEWSKLPKFEASAILNIAEDHIDWHESFDQYANAKLKILSQSKTAILNLNDPEIALRSTGIPGNKVFFGLDTPQAGELGLVENVLVDRAFVSDPNQAEAFAELSDIIPAVPHNVSNAMAAAGLALALKIPHSKVAQGLKSFKLDHHRLELIASSEGIDWVDDSKATNPHAAKAALSSYLSVIWIAGGLAKGASMVDLIHKTSKRIKSAILIGTDRELIAAELSKQAPHVEIFRVEKAGSSLEMMEEIVTLAKKLANKDDTVLLAPACASMDQFKSYAERGDLFAAAVKKLVENEK